MVSKNIIEKIQKLLALGGNNPNENEATTATQMAMDLLAKYNLSMSEVQNHDTEEVSHEDYKPFGRSFPNWKTIILNALCHSHFCNLIIRPGTGCYIIIGKETNRETCKMMFTYLCNVVDFETKEYLKSNDFDRSQGKTYSNSFRLGMANRLRTRLLEKKQEIINQNNQNGLIKVDPFSVAKRQNDDYAYQNFRIGSAKKTYFDTSSSAYSAGFNAGGKIGLSGSRAITA
jgi:hypothetical protein